MPSPYLSAEAIAQMDEDSHSHPLHEPGLRYQRSLSDRTGLQRLGVHMVRVAPGQEATQLHFHHCEEEFIYVLSGRGVAILGDRRVEVGPGDFLGFTAPSAAHGMINPFEEELVYLMGGERRGFDVCDYPQMEKRLIRMGDDRSLMDWHHFNTPAINLPQP